MRVAARGKSFLLAGSPFRFRAARYRSPPESGERTIEEVAADLSAIAAGGHTVVSLPPPPASIIDRSTETRLRFMLELDGLGWHELLPTSRGERRRLTRDLAVRMRRAVRAWNGSHTLLGVVVAAPALIDRAPGHSELVRRIAAELAIALHEEDPALLAAWRSPSPPEPACPAEFDFLVVDFELADQRELAPALMAAHREVGDRPLVLGSVSLGPRARAAEPDPAWLVDTALRCGAAGTFTPARPSGAAAAAAAAANHRTVTDLDVMWPEITVVVTAYNAQETLEECLSHCARLAYPRLELVVVDDGSTDDTPAIAGAHPRARLLSIPHGGLAAARNAGFGAARGQLIAYLDADAYPSPEWPWYLALAAGADGIGGCGGPNVPPAGEPKSARVVARIPGGPVPQLAGPDRAQHLPGCNMAFWRRELEQLGGFDPVFDTAADDVDFEWRLAQTGSKLAYHPAALVWHHRRPGLRRYLRQQASYGRSHAFLERRYPERFPSYYRIRQAARELLGQRSSGPVTYEDSVKYLALPHDESALILLAHQWGMPGALVLGCTAPLGLVRRKLLAPAATAAGFVAALLVTDAVLAGRGRRRSDRTLALRTQVALFRLLRPLAFRWGHLRGRREARAAAPTWPPPPRSREAESSAPRLRA